MNKTDLENLADMQEAFFATHKTLDPGFRKKQLKNLQNAILEYDLKIEDALYIDLHKPAFEAYFETGQVLKEIRYHLRHLRSWVKPRRAATPLFLAFARSYIVPEPYGRVLIFSPWNYPLLLLFSPLVGAISAGNCVTLKPTGKLPALNAILQEMFSKYFDPAYIALINGGHETAEQILSRPADYIFFTGSQQVGKKIMKIAAENLTPVTLELGGKNPCIVHRDADIKIAARRITWGKFINAGQTCVAPDYILAHNEVKEKLISEIKACMIKDYGPDFSQTESLTQMISSAAVIRQEELMKNGKIIIGGETDVLNRIVNPTLLVVDSVEIPVMKEEIFGPVLPVSGYDHLEEVYRISSQTPNPLSLYIFTKDRRVEKEIIQNIASGNVAINDTVVQFSNLHLPLGGKRQSGIGRYHGYYSFETFSHLRSFLRKRIHPDIPLRYLPYTPAKNKLLRKFLR
ncbi:MAG: aldehyde dehydrogenase family protein [Chlorobi bacterium]|nr:aldehyde dehydrogenase family protein [Chlorobiota bacterium]